jgi:hypothetical protein
VRSRTLAPGAPWLQLAERAALGGARITPGTRTKERRTPHTASWRPRSCDRCAEERLVSVRELRGGGDIHLCASCANDMQGFLR